MTADERMPVETTFAMVRRGFDPRQVTERLDECDVEIQALSAARDAALEQATMLGGRLEAARAEIKRLHDELRAMSGLPDSVEGMSERLRVLLRVTEDEFAEMRDTAQHEVAELCSLRERLALDLDASRELIDKALPGDPAPDSTENGSTERDSTERDGHGPARTAGVAITGIAPPVLEPVRAPAADGTTGTTS